MPDLAHARALAAAARENTTAGLEAREQLADVVDELAGALDAFLGAADVRTRVEWATRIRYADGTVEADEFAVAEELARHRFESYPFHVALLARPVTTVERPWIEVASKETADA